MRGGRHHHGGQAHRQSQRRRQFGGAGLQSCTAVRGFVVPVGSGFSVNVPEGCGAPLVVDECKGGGWEMFTFPRTFSDQGDCVAFVLRGGD